MQAYLVLIVRDCKHIWSVLDLRLQAYLVPIVSMIFHAVTNHFLVGKRAVPGTPWCIVWTGDGKHFFFNPSAKLSLWEIPEELRHRGDVAGLIENGPERKDDPPAQPEPTVVEVMTHFMTNQTVLFSKNRLNPNLLFKTSHRQQKNQK